MPESTPKPLFEKDFPHIQDLLACPACNGELRLDKGALACAICGASYPVVDGIPALTPRKS